VLIRWCDNRQIFDGLVAQSFYVTVAGDINITQQMSRAVTCILAGMGFIVINDVATKWMSGTHPVHEIVFVRSLFALPLTVFILAPREGATLQIRTAHPYLNVTRGVLLAIANLGFFLGLAAMPLADAMSLFFVAPLFITMLSVPMLGERVGPQRWAAVCVGMIGVVLMLRPEGSTMQWAALLPIIGAFAYALMQTLARCLGAEDRASTMAFYVQVTFLIIAGFIGLCIGDGRFSGSAHPSLDFLTRAWTLPSSTDMGLLMLCGVCVGFGGYLITQAYRLGPPSVVAPFEYAALPLAVVIGYFLWDESPDGIALLGMLLIVGSGLYILQRERVRGVRS
jgi:drug/metabolite transporter (DMT)-like permease